MISLYQNQDALKVNHARTILEAEGIACFVRNELSHNLVGGSLVGPLKMFDPELCILNDADYAQAESLLQEWLQGSSNASPQPDWKCQACGEMVPGTMQECWNCQSQAP